MILKSVGVLSVGKVLGCVYALFGLIIGGLVSLAALVGAFSNLGDGGGVARIFLGVFAVVVLPIFYGVMAFIVGVIAAAIYNLVAAAIGGIELELEQRPAE